MSTPPASVVICTYTEGRWDRLVAAVDSVAAQNPPAEIVVVVDHDDALLRRARARLGGARVVPNDGPRGLCGARNSGVAAVRGEVVAFLDDDAEARPGWLDRLLEHYGRPEVVGVGGLVVPVWPHGRPSWFPCEFDWVVGCSYRGLPETTAPVRNPIGANMSFRRDLFARVGGFDPRLGRVARAPTGCEETELCIRVRRRLPGAVILHEPRAVVEHHVAEARARFRYFAARCYGEGRSKAVLTRLGGTVAPLAVEARYLTRTLPRGVLSAAGAAAAGADPAGAGRALAIVAGAANTAAGYAMGASWARLGRWGAGPAGGTAR